MHFDPDDLTAESQQRIEPQVGARLRAFEKVVDAHNEARAHLWYEQRFGASQPLQLDRGGDGYLADGGVEPWGPHRGSLGFVVGVPFGLSDLLAMVARPNKVKVAQQIFEEKVARRRAKWPKLRVNPS